MDTEKNFADFYNKYYREIVFYLVKIVHDFSTAEDLAHDTFLKIYNRKNEIEYGDARTKKYLYRAAKNTAIDYQRKKKGEDYRSKKCIDVLKNVDKSFYSEVENFVIEGEVVSTVGDVLEQFPAKNRRIFESKFLENKQIQIISKEEKLSLYKIKKIEKEILDKLKDKLKIYIDYKS